MRRTVERGISVSIRPSPDEMAGVFKSFCYEEQVLFLARLGGAARARLDLQMRQAREREHLSEQGRAMVAVAEQLEQEEEEAGNG